MHSNKEGFSSDLAADQLQGAWTSDKMFVLGKQAL